MAFANSPLIQTRAYVEITVLEKGEFYIGVARRDRKNLDVSVSGGCLLQANFGHAEFQCGPPDDRFEPVIFSRDLLS